MSKWVWVYTISALAVLGVWFLPMTIPNSADSETAKVMIPSIEFQQENGPLTLHVDNSELVKELAQKLRLELGESISHVEIQIGLEDFRQYLRQQYQDNTDGLFRSVIRQAFPAYAESIFANLSLMEEYESWLLAEMKSLLGMSFEQKQVSIWAKRRELFASDADIIWSAELAEREQRMADTQKSIELLNHAYDMEINQRLYALKATIETNFSEQVGGNILSPAMLASTFFSLDSVQQDLEKMSPYERSQQLANIRRDLGFTERQVEKAALKDEKNELRWQVGYQYMGERQALLENLTGEELDTELNRLRISYFGDEASTLEKEEQQGFYRFKRPRVYGRN
ncbi:hypothetical protein GTG28_14640 [Vibrio sp. OCN044]|uniref:Lipase modulator n=1 Tax=Vibrio tetraodonis subsp. pristinus TaxID=2695891 RepID=A0A6L8LWG5_9VIBR|nr:hypothetical protein [Vibrio tetraodonis]MYM60467.1 hypothetical protein [Vibrio tetraodonis subsp. pristinus]